jgi:hypothetical protein
MADKPSANPLSGSFRASSSTDLQSSAGVPPEVEIRLRSTEKVKLVLQRCERTSAPHHLLVRIRELIVTITRHEGSPPTH